MASESERDVPQFIDDAIVADLLFSSDDDAVHGPMSSEVQRVRANIDAAFAARAPDRAPSPARKVDPDRAQIGKLRIALPLARRLATAASFMFYVVIAASVVDLASTWLLEPRFGTGLEHIVANRVTIGCQPDMFNPAVQKLRAQRRDQGNRFDWLGSDPQYDYYYDRSVDRLVCVAQQRPGGPALQNNDETSRSRLAILISVIVICCSGMGLVSLRVARQLSAWSPRRRRSRFSTWARDAGWW